MYPFSALKYPNAAAIPVIIAVPLSSTQKHATKKDIPNGIIEPSMNTLDAKNAEA